MQEYSGDLVAVLNQLKVENTHIMGYSGGGVHAMVLASQAGERIKSISLIASGPHTTKVEMIKPLFEHGPAAYVAMIEQSGPLSTGLKQRMLASDFKAFQAILNSPSMQMDLTGDLPNMHMPFLVLIGENDMAYPPQKERKIFSVVPNLTFITLPGLNHGTSINRSDITIPHTNEFLAQVSKK
jgi:3-oxoadipate enol-lactonase